MFIFKHVYVQLLLNNVKAETGEIYCSPLFIVSFLYLFNDPKLAKRYEQTLWTQIRLSLMEKGH